ncbi:large subunit ribosomal protein LP1 [Nematocida minor]|uniref:large subunit ribosomal protein LP1 n=1 Tax=Nematocida minor TaxID=1912983 RepID=UPI00221F7679|nr:large subunit ribosomal protein LP1 [Nematocida minor]KAI5191614.1 large subunit ribosomal protein LP1 [Nematocida minor]
MIEQKEICVLTTLLLHSLGKDVTENKIKEVGNYLGVNIDSYLAELFSKLSSEQIQSIIENPIGGSVQAASGSAAQAVEEKKEEVEESEEESSGADLDLFG